MGVEGELVQGTEHLQEEVVLLLAPVQLQQAALRQEVAQGLGGLGQVVVRDGGEEQVVDQVAVGDVVVELVDAVTV